VESLKAKVMASTSLLTTAPTDLTLNSSNESFSIEMQEKAFMHINSSRERERVHQRTCVLFINILQNLQKKKDLKLNRRGKQLPG